MRYLCALMGIFLLLAANAAAGSFKADMDVDTYVDANNANQSYSDERSPLGHFRKWNARE